jgi:hypothetical protein
MMGWQSKCSEGSSEAGKDSVMKTTISIMNEKAGNALVRKAAELLKREILERSGVRVSVGAKGDVRIVLSVKDGIGKQGFRIEDGPGGEIRIVGNDPHGVIYGVGKFLRASRFGRGTFVPGSWRGESVPEKPVRGMYFASHFHNFYNDAPVKVVQRYVEDLALWGCNTLAVWFDMHHYTSMDDPRAKSMIRRLRAVLKTANGVGIEAALTTLANEAFSTSPEALRADWTSGHDGYFAAPGGHYHVEICPSKPGGIEKIVEYRRAMLNAFKGIDIGYVWLWPYDQGGCTCSKCTPWGANGFLRAAEAEARLAKEIFPRSKMILSTWYFDHFIRDEWKAFDEAIQKRKPDWIDYVLADDYGEAFPEYVLKHGIPGRYPMVTFAEISMFQMFPWGGYGANPLPDHFQRIWDQCGKLTSGGYPYSEGIFEDINKAIQFQFFWDSKRKAIDTVREYVSYEFSPDAADLLVQAARLMEAGHGHCTKSDNAKAWAARLSKRGKLPHADVYGLKNTDHAEECLALVKQAEKKLTLQARRSWRWRIFAIRAMLDAAIRKSGGRSTEVTERCFDELCRIYGADKAEFAVMPPSLKGLARVYRPT